MDISLILGLELAAGGSSDVSGLGLIGILGNLELLEESDSPLLHVVLSIFLHL